MASPGAGRVILQMETLQGYQHLEDKKTDPKAKRDDENIRTFLSIVPTTLKAEQSSTFIFDGFCGLCET